MRTLIALLLAVLLSSCDKIGLVKEQPPITEEETLRIIAEIENNPLTGKSEENLSKLKAFKAWHFQRGTEMFPKLAAKELDELLHYWKVWKNPKLLDKDDGLYAQVEREQAGRGDEFRAMELQTKFVQLNFGLSREDALHDTEEFILVWEMTRSPTGPYQTKPIPWVLRYQGSQIKEGQEFEAKLASAGGDWKKRYQVSTEFRDSKKVLANQLKDAIEASKLGLDMAKSAILSSFLKELKPLPSPTPRLPYEPLEQIADELRMLRLTR